MNKEKEYIFNYCITTGEIIIEEIINNKLNPILRCTVNQFRKFIEDFDCLVDGKNSLSEKYRLQQIEKSSNESSRNSTIQKSKE